MKKILSRGLLTVIVALNVIGPASAMAAEVQEVSAVPVSQVQQVKDDIVIARAEETTWVYRDYNGWLQKRQWSNTYGKWLTDWINVRPL